MGESMLELPPDRLREMASLVGNAAMEELLESQTPPAEEVWFDLPAEEPDTVAFRAAPGAPQLADPGSLTEGGFAGAAFDPGGLQPGI